MVKRLRVAVVGVALGLSPLAGKAAPGPSGGTPQAPTTRDDSQARDLFFHALENIRAERWGEAERDLLKSQEIVRRPSTLYNLALVAFKQGRLREALSRATSLLDGAAGTPDDKHRRFAEQLRDRTLTDLPRLDVTVRPADAVILVDGEELPERGERRTLRVDPGVTQLLVRAEGYASEQRSVQLVAREVRAMTIELQRRNDRTALPPERSPTKAAEPSAPRVPGEVVGNGGSTSSDAETRVGDSGGTNPWPWVLVGAGSAALVATIATGIAAKDADADFVEQCGGTRDCDPSLRGLQGRVETLGTVTDVLLVTGGLSVAGGGLWWLLGQPGESHTTAAALRGGAVVRLRGRF